MPKSQVKNLYKNNKDNKENQKPVEKKGGHENNNKKVPKKSEKQEPPKPKPKSIESALNLVGHFFYYNDSIIQMNFFRLILMNLGKNLINLKLYSLMPLLFG